MFRDALSSNDIPSANGVKSDDSSHSAATANDAKMTVIDDGAMSGNGSGVDCVTDETGMNAIDGHEKSCVHCVKGSDNSPIDGHEKIGVRDGADERAIDGHHEIGVESVTEWSIDVDDAFP